MPDTTARPPAAADARPPALPSTADAVPYVPVSWLAVGAFGLAALFVAVLLVAGRAAQLEKKPLVLGWVLVLPVAAVVLSFAARRVIRNAEGTRTGKLFGLDLPAAAWWTAVVTGLGYAAYFVAIDYTITRDARAQVVGWADLAVKGDLPRAFHRTRDPNERAAIPQDSWAGLDTRYRNEAVAFRQCDLVRVAVRNPGACEFVPGGMKRWSILPGGGVECLFRGTLRCPEGTFPVQVGLRGTETAAGDAPAGRQWQVFNAPNGYVQAGEVRLTPYGWFVAAVENQGAGFARQFLQAAYGRAARPIAYVSFARAGDDPAFRVLTLGGGMALAGTVGTAALAVWTPPAAFNDEVARRLFTLPGGVAPSADQAKAFAAAWDTTGVEPAGQRLKESPDVNVLTTITDEAVEVRVPVEIPLPMAAGRTEPAAARGRLVVTCTDPVALAELKRLKAEADPTGGTSAAPTIDRPAPFVWKVVRIESDLRPVTVRPPGAPSGMGMEAPG